MTTILATFLAIVFTTVIVSIIHKRKQKSNENRTHNPRGVPAKDSLASLRDQPTTRKYLFEACLEFEKLSDKHFCLQCKEKISKISKYPITDQQWKMILSPTTSTYVIAGAGSGKSSTLAYRVLLLNRFLSIPLNRIHVFSFTRASARDFAKKLSEVFNAWHFLHTGEDLDASTRHNIKAIVSTYHSTAYRTFMKATGVRPQLFDFLGKKDTDDPYYNELLPYNTTNEQEYILSLAHARTFQQNENYRTLCFEQLERIDNRDWVNQTPNQATKAEQDLRIWHRFLDIEKTYNGIDSNGFYNPINGFDDDTSFPHTDPFRVTVANWLSSNNKEYLANAEFKVINPIDQHTIQGRRENQHLLS